MRYFNLILLAVLFPSLASSDEIIHFNPEVLGKKANENVQLVEDFNNTAEIIISPAIVQTDIENGIITAASVYYQHSEVDSSQLISSIDKKYPGTKLEDVCKNDFCTWRVEEQKFLLKLVQEEEEMHRLLYIKFRKFDPAELCENIQKARETIEKKSK